VWTPDDGAVAAGHSVDPAGWRELFDELMFLVAGRFTRVEPRRTAREFVAGLLSPAERKNCWWLAEHAGRCPAVAGADLGDRGMPGHRQAHRAPAARRR
jgi:hypothetical protein